MSHASFVPMEIESGNAGTLETHGTGWFIGFSPWTTSSSLRHMPIDTQSSGLCVKWFQHAPGTPSGEPKPLSEGRTISILVGEASEFRIEFSRSAGFDTGDTRSIVLRTPGVFAAWGPGLYHRAFGLQQACILTLRWMPITEHR